MHLLPAPIFRMTADLQARRRIGLTATLVREDGREGDVFSLIGPKRYDAPWKDIESQGWIAPADCVEVRVTLPEGERLAYATAEPEERYRLASCTHAKTLVAEQLVKQHQGEPTLVIGQYLDQLDELAEHLDAPVIKGETTVKERERLYEAFRTGEIDLLVVSKVANFSIDLPEAAVAIQVSRQLRLAAGGGPAARPAAAAQGRRQEPRGSTRSSAATPSTPTSPRTGSASSPSRATPTASWMRPTCDRSPLVGLIGDQARSPPPREHPPRRDRASSSATGSSCTPAPAPSARTT